MGTDNAVYQSVSDFVLDLDFIYDGPVDESKLVRVKLVQILETDDVMKN